MTAPAPVVRKPSGRVSKMTLERRADELGCLLASAGVDADSYERIMALFLRAIGAPKSLTRGEM